MINQRLRHLHNIRHQPIQQIKAHILPDNHSQDLCPILLGRQRVVGNDPLPRPEQQRDSLLLNVRELALELIREPKRHNRQAGDEVSRRLGPGLLLRANSAGNGVFDLVRRLGGELGGAGVVFLGDGAVDVADAGVPACGLQAAGEDAGVGEAVLCNLAVAREAEVDQVVVLDDDLRAGAGEVEREGLLGAAEVVEFEDEVLGEEGLVAPDDPADAGGDEAVFVAWGTLAGCLG